MVCAELPAGIRLETVVGSLVVRVALALGLPELQAPASISQNSPRVSERAPR